MKKLLLAAFLLSLFSCQKKQDIPDGILKPQKMQLVFWDYIRADVFAADFIKKDSSLNDTLENIKLQNKIFNFYKISRNDFYKSYDYYTEHPELMNVLMDSMIARQNRLRTKNQLYFNRQRLLPKEKLLKAE